MSCKFKVGDLVIGNDKANSYTFTKKGWIGRVESIEKFALIWGLNGEYISISNVTNPSEKYVVEADCFDLYDPHEGKILIMVDEKDHDKIIARDLITNKTAEAKRNPKDDWDFNNGAKLALERLTEPEKPKGWTGKVVCIQADHGVFGKFVKGKIYRVENGRIFCEDGWQWFRFNDDDLFMSANEVDSHFSRLFKGNTRFVEYKGGAEE